MSQEEKIALYFSEGSSDKEYHAHLLPRDSGWIVNFAYGRRGAALTTGVKTPSPVPYDKAKKIFDKLVGEKTAKGYVPDAAGRAFSVGPDAGRKANIALQLSNPIDVESDDDLDMAADLLCQSPAWIAQEKMDGVRCAVEIKDGVARGINRKGLYVDLPPGVRERYEVAFFGPNATVLDGELVGDVHHVFDAIKADGDDLASLPAIERFRYLRKIFSKMSLANESVKFVDFADSAQAKARLVADVRERGGEGVVFKSANAPYTPGRPASGGASLKLKFWDSATVRVAGVNEGKRSVQMEMRDGDVWIGVGNVTVPANQPIPKRGDFAEVRYLYAYDGGSLFQPTLLGVRKDIDEDACLISSLKFKSEPPTPAAGPSP